MLRFASDSTTDMHINELRIALFNYLIAKQCKEDFIIRIENGDGQETLDILALFSLDYAQVVHQNQNFRFHSAMALQLLHEKKAFSCFCSPQWLNKKKKEAQEQKRDYCYDDACRNLPAELVIDNTAPFTVRIIRPTKAIIIQDQIQGEVQFHPDSVDSFVIMHEDKTPTSEFASAVEDMLSDISTVVTTKDHLLATAREIHVRNELGYDKAITYAHVAPLDVKENITVKHLLAEGYLPEAILNYLISIGNITPKSIFTLKEAQEWFDIKNLSSNTIAFDLQKLKEYNKEHLKLMDATELSRYVGFADAEIGELARLYIDVASTTKELKTHIAPIFEPRVIPKEFEAQSRELIEIIKTAPYFENYNEFQTYVMQKTQIEDTQFTYLMRLLLTNRNEGPDLAQIYKYLKNYIGEIIK